ncbi:hypothetical protein [Snodgrassella communis]|uniref:Uncharacterized protein n=1 Tax=Snodgrassella communis TaxID=2946699 RepID=A0A836Z3Y5_9NEIS|nr:hypothetical protein [Snodgrassella communis]KDN13025.1 hypothetical protein SALWKB12_0832 [Snodgrassella communis]KDN14063.1 hypothetical protein SALWKB29_1853 [Snodgrassella communis]
MKFKRTGRQCFIWSINAPHTHASPAPLNCYTVALYGLAILLQQTKKLFFD